MLLNDLEAEAAHTVPPTSPLYAACLDLSMAKGIHPTEAGPCRAPLTVLSPLSGACTRAGFPDLCHSRSHWSPPFPARTASCTPSHRSPVLSSQPARSTTRNSEDKEGRCPPSSSGAFTQPLCPTALPWLAKTPAIQNLCGSQSSHAAMYLVSDLGTCSSLCLQRPLPVNSV